MIPLRLVPKEAIDLYKWDSCIHFSFDGNPFGYSWALNAFQKNWAGIVEGDYDSVFPVFYKNSDTIYHPDHIPFLGLYAQRNKSKSRLNAFYTFLKQGFNCLAVQFPNDIKETEDERFSAQSYFAQLTYDAARNIFEKEEHSNQKWLEENIKIEQCNKPEEIANFMKVSDLKSYHPDKVHAAHRFMYHCLHRGIGSGYKVTGHWKKVQGYLFLVFSHSTVWSVYYFFTKKARKRNIDAFVLHKISATYKDQFLRVVVPAGHTSPLDDLLGYSKEFYGLLSSEKPAL